MYVKSDWPPPPDRCIRCGLLLTSNKIHICSKNEGWSNSVKTEKPPKGLTPEFIWKEQRFEEISQAIARRIPSRFEIPIEWVEERNRLVRELNDKLLKRK